MPPNETHVEEIAKAAGREAARELLLALGIDASTPRGIQKAQRDFAFLGDLRTGTEAVKRKTLMWLVGTVLTAVAAWIVLGMKHG